MGGGAKSQVAGPIDRQAVIMYVAGVAAFSVIYAAMERDFWLSSFKVSFGIGAGQDQA